ncbi:MAG TPA: hypothetical protein VFS17_09415 [Methylophilaceae bacterium]|nr:hypothetical protein [Methylophilaceae bacterium]
MAIRKRSALLLGILGFFSGVAFAQYRRRLSSSPAGPLKKPAVREYKAIPAVPMQVMDESLANARLQDKTGYTTH